MQPEPREHGQPAGRVDPAAGSFRRRETEWHCGWRRTSQPWLARPSQQLARARFVTPPGSLRAPLSSYRLRYTTSREFRMPPPAFGDWKPEELRLRTLRSPLECGHSPRERRLNLDCPPDPEA